MSHLIAPSLLASDFANLQSECEMLNASDADWFHLDIMDGNFVPNISYGMPVIKAINQHTLKPLDVHLMIEKPERFIVDFKEVGANILTVHYEASTHLHRTIYAIKDEGMKAGVAINPHTSVELLEPVIEDADMFLIMSVNPGFGGQKFIENTYRRISRLKELIEQKNTDTIIEVDGGVNIQNAPKLVEAGADVLVAGSSIFKTDNPAETITGMKNFEQVS